MWASLKVVLAFTVALLPGGFALLFGYVALRAVRAGLEAQRAQSGEAHLKDVVAHLHFKDILREARAAL